MPIDIHLNVDAILWLEKGVYLDETSGYIDNFCRFVAPGEVVLTWTDDRNDPQYEISAAALKRLQEAKDARGRSIKVLAESYSNNGRGGGGGRQSGRDVAAQAGDPPGCLLCQLLRWQQRRRYAEIRRPT